VRYRRGLSVFWGARPAVPSGPCAGPDHRTPPLTEFTAPANVWRMLRTGLACAVRGPTAQRRPKQAPKGPIGGGTPRRSRQLAAIETP
jgi:hypothetical protein